MNIDDRESVGPIDPRNIRIRGPATECFKDQALKWFDFGLKIVPIVPGEKRTTVGWSWADELSREKVDAYWTANPNHEIGCILGEDLIVFDADDPASNAALADLELRHGNTPNMIVRTSKGVHHYYRLAPGTFARQDSHKTADHPDRIDVKTGRALIVLPPSGGRRLLTPPLTSTADLIEVNQDFIDAVFVHNGRDIPRAREGAPSLSSLPVRPDDQRLAELAALLHHLNPGCGYQDWLQVLMALHHETGGSESGLELADAWSRGGANYCGRRQLEAKWGSFRLDTVTAFSIATLIKMVDAAGFDGLTVAASAGPQFARLDGIEGHRSGDAPHETQTMPPNPLDRYSLRGRSQEVEKNAIAQVPLLGNIALQGQFTAIYAAPNAGKTLIVLHLLIEAITQGGINSAKVYYINVDDDSNGLLTKLRIAEEYGFHMLAEGYRDFTAAGFLTLMREMIEFDQARGVVIIFDTLKKVVDLMSKERSSAFTRVARQFVLKGGTLVGLAHTNKNPGADGKPIFSGTSDLRDDADCAYTARPLPIEASGSEKAVVFENIKRRGNVAFEAAYSYTVEPNASYHELLASVRSVDPLQLPTLIAAETARNDEDVIATALECIAAGVNTKMRLAETVAQRAGVSKRRAVRVIEKYTGAARTLHRWNFVVGERGAKVFRILDATPATLGDKP